MKSIATLAIATTLLFASPAGAQTETWQTVTDTAIASADTNTQIALFKKSLQLAKTPKEKFNSNLYISYIRYNQEIYGESVYYAGEALKIADADIPNDSALRTKAVQQKFKAMRKVGREDEGWKLLAEDIKRKSAKSDHIWTTGENGVVHRFTNFTCPDFVAEMPRKSKTSYNTAGSDVGCGYSIISDKLNVVTVYFALAGDVTDLTAIEHADQAMMDRLPEAKKLVFRKQAKFVSGNGRPVYYTLLTTGTPQSGEQYTGAWSQVIGKWELSARVTWDSDLGLSFGAQKVAAVFDQTTQNVRKQFEVCKALEAPKTGKRVARDDTLATVMFNSLMGGLVEELEKNEKKGQNKPGTVIEIPDKPRVIPKQPDITCLAGSTSGNEITLGYHPGSNRRYSTYSAVIEDTYYVEKVVTLDSLNEGNTPHYVLKKTKDGVESSYQIYDGEPNATLVFEDIIGVVNGKIDALGSVSVDEKGQTSVTINPDILGGEEESK